MKSSTLLDSIAFQLTPTRTRCDLVITANGKTEKIASGLLDPFLAHLKAAREQIGKGGYSIVLAPNRESDTPWFTKGTVERFVRFVSTPEILERVYTIESEILQIEKAISLQGNSDVGLHNVVDLPLKSEVSLEGSKLEPGGNDSNEEKAIVLYQPVGQQAAENESTVPEKNSKVQLVEVLETRKTVLQKEQGMAFARAGAASFDVDNIAALLSFAECFGASRMMDACKTFVHLCKAKHESGQWIEVGATEVMSCLADAPSTNVTGIVFHTSNESLQGEIASDKNGISDHHHESQPHPMFAPWQMNPQANGMPVFQPHAMQGMPYYQNYPGNNMFFHPPYPPQDNPRLHPGQKTRQRRHSMDSGAVSAELETEETTTDEDVSVTRGVRKKGGKASKKQAKTLVIRNINYIASAKQGSGDSDPQSCSDSGTDDDEGHTNGKETRKTRKKGVSQMSDKPQKSFSGDGENWQAFQNFLLTDADESRNSVNSMLAMEGKFQGRKQQTAIGDASSGLRRHSMGGSDDISFSDQLDLSGETTSMRKHGFRSSADTSMDYIFNRQGKQTDLADSSLDLVISNGFPGSSNSNNKGSSHDMADESLAILNRTGSLDQVSGDGRAAMDMDYQLSSVLEKADNYNVGSSQSIYEPHDLNLIPNRATEDGQIGYDPAMDYEMQAQVKETTQQSGDIKKVALGTKQGPKKTVKDQKLKAERNPASTRREKPSKSSPLEDARARAEKLRAYKADLQKLKKEKEDEQLKRLEALKIERQKRIAARSGTTVPQSPSSSQQPRKQLPKLSPISQTSSKFSDTEPGSSSPLQRSTLKLLPKELSSSSKISKPGRSNSGSHLSGHRLTRSASSLSMRKEENNGPTRESKATIARIRRLSEPKSSLRHVSSGNTLSTEAVSRKKVAEKTDMKLRASRGSSLSIQKKLTNKGKSQKPSEKMLSTALNPPRDESDITVVEKTVIMHEFEKPATPVFHQPEDEIKVHNMQLSMDKDQGGKSEEDAPIPPPASPIIVKEVDCEPSSREGKGHSHTCLNKSEDVSPNFPNVSTTERPYQAPYARVSSIEDPCMAESDYGKAPPTSFLTGIAGVQTATALVSDGQKQDLVTLSQAASVKNQGKDSSKGFKRLLKFGRRSSTASDSSIDLDKASFDGSSSEGFTLKNLLIQEEGSSASTTPKKSSRSFSLLSPFKSKNAEKKSDT